MKRLLINLLQGRDKHLGKPIVSIGPECFALASGEVLCWRGENYVPQRPSLRTRLHNWLIARENTA